MFYYPRPDHLIDRDQTGALGKNQIFFGLPDDLMGRGKADASGKALDGDGVAVVDEGGNGIMHRYEFVSQSSMLLVPRNVCHGVDVQGSS